ncbi:N-acetyl-gamma-glutamyl-phosphate reductase [Bremerella cremea]|uniref:N-acetyl-gamma-glutamyl-phosphate reductase n=1 Tax=Blastopirellula marina TaxID=124 RepID=A0A2S8FBM7_9BACT|nr:MULTISPECIES: N-acetyl-gamma-glutamyl-phosphate reductase [Pirellulaceae]PQO29565.1 N-acetyl-gamma-glutamyl-phosphate reductase [Blastopirellula marina]RCS42869.1 N-acetyl-gamma-glutamyl-phosphate reductase [Bremerella cremea]
MTVRVGIMGATGYTALELLKILVRHPQVEVTALTTRSEDRPHVSSIHPQFHKVLDLHLENWGAKELAENCDCVFGCLPHAASASVIPEILDAGMKVVDLSADYRLNDPDVYSQWYGADHPDAERMKTTVYGLPELFREGIAEAQLVANPGCYPTGISLSLAPLLKNGFIRPDGIIADCKSGVSGAGRTPKMGTLYPECNESFSAYGVGTHRHMPEIEQNLSVYSGHQATVIFTPHLVPMDRGILSTCYAIPEKDASEKELLGLLEETYQNEPFVRVRSDLPATKHVAGTNFCDITVRRVKDRVITISCIDNLIKGASGAAVQNFNLMYGFAETTALL